MAFCYVQSVIQREQITVFQLILQINTAYNSDDNILTEKEKHLASYHSAGKGESIQ